MFTELNLICYFMIIKLITILKNIKYGITRCHDRALEMSISNGHVVFISRLVTTAASCL